MIYQQKISGRIRERWSYPFIILVDTQMLSCSHDHSLPLLSRLPLMNNQYRPTLNLRSDEHKMAVKERKLFVDHIGFKLPARAITRVFWRSLVISTIVYTA